MKHNRTAFCYLSPNPICVYCFLQINSVGQMFTDPIIEKEIESSLSSTEVLQYIFFQQKLIISCEF